MLARERVAWNLRRVRVAARLSQEALAVDADVDRTYISGIETGTFNASLDVLDRLASALSVDVAELVALPDPTEVRPKPLPGGRRKLRS